MAINAAQTDQQNEQNGQNEQDGQSEGFHAPKGIGGAVAGVAGGAVAGLAVGGPPGAVVGAVVGAAVGEGFGYALETVLEDNGATPTIMDEEEEARRAA